MVGCKATTVPSNDSRQMSRGERGGTPTKPAGIHQLPPGSIFQGSCCHSRLCPLQRGVHLLITLVKIEIKSKNWISNPLEIVSKKDKITFPDCAHYSIIALHYPHYRAINKGFQQQPVHTRDLYIDSEISRSYCHKYHG